MTKQFYRIFPRRHHKYDHPPVIKSKEEEEIGFDFEFIDMQKEELQDGQKDDNFSPSQEIIMSESAGEGIGIHHSLEEIQKGIHEDHGPASPFQGDADKNHLRREKQPLHSALGGGKSADILLWRNKQVSAGMLAGATVIWLLFEWIGYHLLTFVCHALILMLALLFLWSNLSFFVNKAPLEFPDIVLPEDLCKSIVLYMRDECNLALGIFYDIASGRDLKKFLYSILSLWIVSVVSSWFDFLTVLYITFVVLLTLPLFYEKHEHQVDTYAKKATVQLKRQYGVLDEKVLQKMPSLRRKQNSD